MTDIPTRLVDVAARAFWEWSEGEEPRHERWHHIHEGTREYWREQVTVVLAAVFAECNVNGEQRDGQ